MFQTLSIFGLLLDAVIMNEVPKLRLPKSNEGKKSMKVWEWMVWNNHLIQQRFFYFFFYLNCEAHHEFQNQ